MQALAVEVAVPAICWTAPLTENCNRSAEGNHENTSFHNRARSPGARMRAGLDRRWSTRTGYITWSAFQTNGLEAPLFSEFGYVHAT